MTLHLTLTKEWFYRHLDDKTEEYRELTPYWCNKLLLYQGEEKPRKFWEDYGCNFKQLSFGLQLQEVTFKPYELVIFSNGMRDMKILPRFSKRVLEQGIRKGKEEWGAKPNVFYFTIRCGNAFDLKNCFKYKALGALAGSHGLGRKAAAMLEGQRSKSILTVPSSQIEQMPGLSAENWIKDEAREMNPLFIPQPIKATMKLDEILYHKLNGIYDDLIQQQVEKEKNFIFTAIERHIGHELTIEDAERITRNIDVDSIRGSVESYWIDYKDAIKRKKLFSVVREDKKDLGSFKSSFSTILRIIDSCLDSD